MEPSYSFTIPVSKPNIKDNKLQEYIYCQPRWEQDLLDGLQWMVSPFIIQHAIASENIIFSTDGPAKHNNAPFACIASDLQGN